MIFLPTLFVSCKVIVFGDHNNFVELPCHIGHDIDEVIIASHALFEFFRKLGSVAGLTNKSVMYDDHINSIWFVNNRTAGQR